MNYTNDLAKDQNFKFDNEILQIKIAGAWERVTFNRYYDVKLEGHGSNAVVLSGIHKITNRRDGIKVYMPHRKSKDGKVVFEKFLDEVQKIAKLSNDQFVRVYDAEDMNNGIYVVYMEFIVNGDGERAKTLNEWCKTFLKNSTKFDKIAMCRRILDAVLAYQSQGIIHGDIHDKNILVDDKNGIHIIDFGSSFFSKGDQSLQRESFLVYNIVRKILGKLFDKNWMLFNCPGSLKDEFKPHDVRTYDPFLVSKTLKAYLEAIDYLEQIPPNGNPWNELKELILSVTKGIYIQFPYVIDLLDKYINRRDRDKVERAKIINVVFDNISNNIFNEGDIDFEMADVLEYDTLCVYYELAKMCLNQKVDIITIKERILGKSSISKGELNSYIEAFLKSQAQSYEEFSESFMAASNTELDAMRVNRSYREILYEILAYTIKSDALRIVLIWQKYNERLVKKMREKSDILE